MKNTILLILATIFFASCESDNYTPKPTGYFRIDLPEKKYQTTNLECPFQFEIPIYANITRNPNQTETPCWFDINFTNLNASIYMSYKPVNDNINDYLEDSRTLAFKHTVKAFDIEQNTISFPERNVYGLVYEIEGNTASSYQFHLTDSNNHFIRGSLYFNNVPNQDSIQPVLTFIKKDIEQIFNTLEWK